MAMNFEAPQGLLDFLKLREGWRTNVYLDSVGKPTVGMGHLLTDSENGEYHVGATVPDDILNRWTASDVQQAYNAALNQTEHLGLDSQDFANALASVNFQLGTSWFSKFPKTWSLMRSKQWQAAANEIKQSLWYKQTPVRVEDFILALEKLTN